MSSDQFRFLLINAFSMPAGAQYSLRATDGPKEGMLMNYESVAPSLEDVDWEIHPGPVTTHGTSLVETREEFCMISAARLPVVREACESGRYNGIILLGGGDPGFPEAREIGQRYGIPVNAGANAQMHIASMLGNRFSVIDVSEAHSMHYRSLILAYGFAERCASIRNINTPLPRGNGPGGVSIQQEKEAVESGRSSQLLETAFEQAVAAVEEDGAEVFIIGCSALYWLRPHLERHLFGLGWEVPVLEGHSSAIEVTKMMVRLGLSASGVAFPKAPATRFRRVKRF